MTDRRGTVISGRYVIRELLGEGGMGAVYLAEHVLMRKLVALKLLHADMSDNAEVSARFEREAMASSHIAHPNVAAATDFGRTEDGAFFLVLEYVEGANLRTVLDAGPMPTPRAIHIARQIALGLERAHDAGIVHRDLKPENVMLVRRDDDPDFVKVLDFGIAKLSVETLAQRGSAAQQQPLTRLGTVIGTPEYMAPEQALGEPVSPQSDLYALGVMLYEMLTGLHPFDPPDRMTMLSFHIVAPVPRMNDRAANLDVPPAIEAIVRRLLEKDSKARYPSARALIEALDEVETAVAPDRSTATRDDAPPPAAAPPRRPRMTVALAGPVGLIGIVAVAVAVVAWSVLSGTPGASLPTTSASVAPKTKLAPDARVATAAEQGPEALEALAREYPEDASVVRRAALAYHAQARRPDTLRELRALLVIDPHAAEDAEVVSTVGALAASAAKLDADDDAFGLLEGPLKERGVDVLVSLSSGATKGATREAVARASKSLAKPDVRVQASAAASVWLDLKAAKTCAAKREVLARAREHGDTRILASLKALRSTRGCSFLGRFDCWPCLRGDGALDEAITAVETRGPPSP